MTRDPLIRPGPGEPQNPDVGDQERWLCAVCRVATVQTIVRSWWVHHALGHDWEERDAYALLQCDGCKSVSLMHRRWTPDTETTHCDEDGESAVQPDATLLPARSELGLCLADNDVLRGLPWPILQLWKETRAALNQNQLLLGAIGARAIAEAILKHRGVSDKTLQKMIETSKSKGEIPSAVATLDHDFRDLGNAAAHDVNSPDRSRLQRALRDLDHLIHTEFELPQHRRTESLDL